LARTPRLTANRGGRSREKYSPLGPERLVFLASFFLPASALALTFTSRLRCQLLCTKQPNGLSAYSGAPEDQPGRTSLTQTRRDGFKPQQLVSRYRRGQSFYRKLAEAVAQSNATGSAQLDARDDGLHNYFIHQTAALAYNPLLASTLDRLPAPAYVR
jgi:hypothetical protein